MRAVSESIPGSLLDSIRLRTEQASIYAADPHAEHDRKALLAEIDRLSERLAIVDAFLAERAEFVTTLRQCIDDDADYYRWQGHAEARRVLPECLGVPVAWPAEDAAKPGETR